MCVCIEIVFKYAAHIIMYIDLAGPGHYTTSLFHHGVIWLVT